MSSGDKSFIRRIFEKTAGGTALARTQQHVKAGAEAIRAGGESLVAGSLLGAVACYNKTGLDVALDGAGKYSLPIDGALAALGILGGTMLAHEDYGKDVANIGAGAAAVFSFRKTQDYLAAKLRMAGTTPGYQLGRDYQKATGSILTGGIHGESGFGGEEQAVAPQMPQRKDPILEAAKLL